MISAIRISVQNRLSIATTKFLSSSALRAGLSRPTLNNMPLILILLSTFLFGCSVYRSEGRKFLEKYALEYENAAATANLLGCSRSIETSGYRVMSEGEAVDVLQSEADANNLRIVSHATHACDFQFGSAQEIEDRLTSAIELTLQHPTLD